MLTPNLVAREYVSAAAFNSAYGAVSGDLTILATANRTPGLVYPEAATLTTGAGLAVTGTFPAPFGVIFSGGTLAQAHGTNTNQDTQTYAVDFTPVASGVASGSPVTAYLVATLTTIQQQPFTVTGPPPGHPDYNPAFVPYTAYAVVVDTLAVTGVSGTAPNNTTTFEIARTSTPLSSASTGVSLTTGYQVRAGTLNVFPYQVVSGALSASQAGQLLFINGPTQLPSSQSCQGLVFTFTNSSSGTIQAITTSGADLIFGVGSTPVSGVASVTLNPSTCYSFQAGQPGWQTLISNAKGGAAAYAAVTDASGKPLYPFLSAVSGVITPGNIASFVDVSGTVKDSGISSGSVNQVQAWCDFNLSDGSIASGSYNVASVTVSALTGVYVVNTTGITLVSGGIVQCNADSFSGGGARAVPQICSAIEIVGGGANPTCRLAVMNYLGAYASSGQVHFSLLGK